MLRLQTTETIFTENRTQDSFSGLWPLFLNFLFESKNFGLGAVLLPCLVSGLQKPFSPGIEPRTVSRGCGLCSCNLLFETTFVLALFFYRACFWATGRALSGTRTQDTFPEFWPSYVFSLVSRNKHDKFGVNQFVCSRAISKHTYKYTTST
jgi:hypothetical protein